MSVRRPLSLTVRCLSIVAGLALASPAQSQSQSQSGVHARWLEFQSNPRAFLNSNPPKSNAADLSLFSAKEIRSGSFVEKKATVRLGQGGDLTTPLCDDQGICLPDVLQGRAKAHERVEDFLDRNEFEAKGVAPALTLEDMEQRNLLSAHLEETPWSDTYWPISQGILGARYNSSSFVGRGHNWKSYFDFIHAGDTVLMDLYKSQNQDQIENLSPSEKYDLLIGDLSGNGRTYEAGYLTPKMWSEGETYWSQSGQVEGWMGICHGWAPASSMLPRPRTAVSTPAADGTTTLKFYPSDLKGLASYLWAKSSGPTHFMGGRCNDKNPEQDPETGRILSERCFDTNPGNWHIAIINQIGVAKRSFVMDATYDYEVWNQPVYSYAYTYFNPQTGQATASLSEAKVAIQGFSNDKFKKFRSPDAAYAVGISMDVRYVVETYPTHRETDSPDYDAVQTVSYMYDLELNEAGQIIGGEWYTNKHPDFLWMPVADSRAMAFGDSQLNGQEGTWKPGQPLPRFWRDIAIATATRFGQPLATIVEPLLNQAAKEQKQ